VSGSERQQCGSDRECWQSLGDLAVNVAS